MSVAVGTSFHVSVDQGRLPRPFQFLGETIFIKVSGADTAGRYTILEEITPPQSGPPLHIHLHQDEWLYIAEGDCLCEIDGHQRVVRPGDSVFVGKGVPHSFRNIGNAPSRVLAMVEPAATLEQFFAELASACKDGPPDMTLMGQLFEKHGLILAGPPITPAGI